MVWTSRLAPVSNAVLIRLLPCPGIGPHRSRGMDSIISCRVFGTTRTRMMVSER